MSYGRDTSHKYGWIAFLLLTFIFSYSVFMEVLLVLAGGTAQGTVTRAYSEKPSGFQQLTSRRSRTKYYLDYTYRTASGAFHTGTTQVLQTEMNAHPQGSSLVIYYCGGMSRWKQKGREIEIVFFFIFGGITLGGFLIGYWSLADTFGWKRTRQNEAHEN